MCLAGPMNGGAAADDPLIAGSVAVHLEHMDRRAFGDDHFLNVLADETTGVIGRCAAGQTNDKGAKNEPQHDGFPFRMTGHFTIRPADLEADALAIVDGARDFISRMDYREFLPADADLAAAVGRILAMDQVETLVAEHEGRIVGGIGVLYAPHIWNPGLMAGEELFWWTARAAPAATALRLLRAARASARKRGAAMVTFKSLTSSPPGVDRVYRRMGLRPAETAYVGAP